MNIIGEAPAIARVHTERLRLEKLTEADRFEREGALAKAARAARNAKDPGRRGFNSSEGGDADSRLLVERMTLNPPGIYDELLDNGFKRSHGVWWLFPTPRGGRSDHRLRLA